MYSVCGFGPPPFTRNELVDKTPPPAEDDFTSIDVLLNHNFESTSSSNVSESASNIEPKEAESNIEFIQPTPPKAQYSFASNDLFANLMKNGWNQKLSDLPDDSYFFLPGNAMSKAKAKKFDEIAYSCKIEESDVKAFAARHADALINKENLKAELFDLASRLNLWTAKEFGILSAKDALDFELGAEKAVVILGDDTRLDDLVFIRRRFCKDFFCTRNVADVPAVQEKFYKRLVDYALKSQSLFEI